MCQEGSNIDVPLSLHFARHLSVVDHRYKPVSVVPDIEDHVAIYRICILEYAANFRNVVPANRFDDGFPRSNLVSCIGMLFNGLLQMLKRNDVHQSDSTSQYVKLSSFGENASHGVPTACAGSYKTIAYSEQKAN